MTKFWKNPAPAATNEFEMPVHACYACNDTGIVHDSDGRLSQFLGEKYDQQSDLVLICHCHAAYPSKELNEQGKPIRSGYRTDGGQIMITFNEVRKKEVAIGADCPKEACLRLSRQRYEAWKEMKFLADWAREEAKEDPDFKPDWINSAYDQIDTTDWAVTNVRGFTSIGSVLHDHVKQRTATTKQAPDLFFSTEKQTPTQTEDEPYQF
jgi:hypothetical protein